MNSFDIAIVIGGADGVSEEVKQKAYQKWSLSLLTFPHLLKGLRLKIKICGEI